jgi:exonuclease III
MKEASHFYRDGKGSRLDLVLVSPDAAGNAQQKDARVIQWKDAFKSRNYLRDLIDRISDHMPVLSRFYFRDRVAD